MASGRLDAQPIEPQLGDDVDGLDFLFLLCGLLDIVLHAHLHPLGEGDLVAVVEEAQLSLQAIALQRLPGLLDVAGRRRIAIAAGRPALARRNAGRLQVLQDRRAAERRMQRAETEGRVQLGVLAAIVVLHAERHPTAKTERLSRFFADGRRFLQLRQDGIELFHRRDGLVALAGIRRQIHAHRVCAGQFAFHRPADGPDFHVERLGRAAEANETEVRGILHAQRDPTAAGSGGNVAYRLRLAHAPRDAVVDVRDVEIGGFVAAIGETHFVAWSSAIAEGIQERIQLRVPSVVSSPAHRRVSRVR